jgi:hypothetical protein
MRFSEMALASAVGVAVGVAVGGGIASISASASVPKTKAEATDRTITVTTNTIRKEQNENEHENEHGNEHGNDNKDESPLVLPAGPVPADRPKRHKMRSFQRLSTALNRKPDPGAVATTNRNVNSNESRNRSRNDRHTGIFCRILRNCDKIESSTDLTLAATTTSTAKSFEVCHLSNNKNDLDLGILSSECASEEDICILPNVIGFDVLSSNPIADANHDSNHDDSNHDDADDDADDDGLDAPEMGICYPRASMHESYWRQMATASDDENTVQDRALWSVSADIAMNSLTRKELHFINCNYYCSGFDRVVGGFYAGLPSISHYLGAAQYTAYYNNVNGTAVPSEREILQKLVTACWNSHTMINIYNFTGYPSTCPFDLEIPWNCWDISGVTDLSEAFAEKKFFNEPLDCWDTSAVTDMSGLFRYASSFNQSIDMWDTGNVKNMSKMFYIGASFDQPIASWNTSNVEDTSMMFGATRHFNQPIDAWDVSNNKDMTGMFFAAQSFDQPLDSWDTHAVTSLYGTFVLAMSFNQPIDSWNTTDVSTLQYTFRNAYAFNQPLQKWDVSAVTSMTSSFYGAKLFDQPLDGNGWDGGGDSWDVSAVTSFAQMFKRAERFNQCLGTWASHLAKHDTTTAVSTQKMLLKTACPVPGETVDGTPPVDRGPWCQDEHDGCYSSVSATAKNDRKKSNEDSKKSDKKSDKSEKKSKSLKYLRHS